MQSVRKKPCPLLQPYIECYISILNLNSGPVQLQDKFIPSAGAGWVFHFGDPFYVISRDQKQILPRNFFVGHVRKFLNIQSGNFIDSMIVRFKPLGFYQLFSFPADVLSEENQVSAADIDGKEIEMLYEKVGLISDPHKRIDIIEQYLIQKLIQGNIQKYNKINRAVDYIIAKKGCLKIDSLYKLTNSLDRTFQRDFLKQIGIPAKSFARLERVNNIIKQTQNEPDTNWLDIMDQFGYFDQAHLIHDFKSVTGEAPALFLNKDLTQTRIISASF